MTRPESAMQPASGPSRPIRWREYLTTQRIIILGFALVEAGALVWTVAYVMLRDAAR